MRNIITFIINRLQSVRYAWAGVKDMLMTEHNAWIHAIATVTILAMAAWLKLTFMEMVMIVIVIMLVWVAEAFNTVLEVVVNMVSPRYSKVAKRAKDIAAGAVFIAAIGAATVGLLLLGPPLLEKIVR